MARLVSVQVAKLAAMKGFDEPCFDYFTVGRISKVRPIRGVPYEGHRNSEIIRDACLACPTQDDLRAWLRRVFRIDITIMIRFHDCYGIIIHKDRNIPKGLEEVIVKVNYENQHDVYGAALEIALEMSLNLIP